MPEKSLLIDDAAFDRHEPLGYHPERPERLAAARAAVGSAKVDLGALALARGERGGARARSRRPKFVEALDELRGKKGMIDPDTYVSERSIDAAKRAAGGAADMTAAIVRGDATSGVALLRPPGHHARPAHAMGFCLINNVAVAAARGARARPRSRRDRRLRRAPRQRHAGDVLSRPARPLRVAAPVSILSGHRRGRRGRRRRRRGLHRERAALRERRRRGLSRGVRSDRLARARRVRARARPRQRGLRRRVARSARGDDGLAERLRLHDAEARRAGARSRRAGASASSSKAATISSRSSRASAKACARCSRTPRSTFPRSSRTRPTWSARHACAKEHWKLG